MINLNDVADITQSFENGWHKIIVTDCFEQYNPERQRNEIVIKFVNSFGQKWSKSLYDTKNCKKVEWLKVFVSKTDITSKEFANFEYSTLIGKSTWIFVETKEYTNNKGEIGTFKDVNLFKMSKQTPEGQEDVKVELPQEDEPF